MRTQTMKKNKTPHLACTRLTVAGSASLGVTASTARSIISCSFSSASSRLAACERWRVDETTIQPSLVKRFFS